MDIIKKLLEKYVSEWNENPTNATVPYSQVITDLDQALKLLQTDVMRCCTDCSKQLTKHSDNRLYCANMKCNKDFQ